MKKSYFIRLFIILLLCFLLALTAIAHPGKLDSNGGHYVRSPGHGYPVGSYHYHDGSSVSVSSSEAKTSSVKIAEETTPEKQIAKSVIELTSDLFFVLQNNQFIEVTKYAVSARPLNGPVINSLPVVKTASGNIKINATDEEIKTFIKFSYQLRRWTKYKDQPKQQPNVSVLVFDKIKNRIKTILNLNFLFISLLFILFTVRTFFYCKKVSFLNTQISELQRQNLTLKKKIDLMKEDTQQIEEFDVRLQESIQHLENSLRFKNNQVCFLFNKIDELEKENEQLRNQLKNTNR